MKTVTAFGMRDLQVALPPGTPGTEPTWVDVPSVVSAMFKLNTQEVEQWGDDIYQGSFYHSQKGTITVKFNKLSLEFFELITGNTVTSAASVETIHFGTNLELIPPFLVVRGKTAYRDDATGLQGMMTIYWYKADVKTPWDNFPGGEFSKLAEPTLQFNTYPSALDHKRDPIPVAYETAFGHCEV